MALPSCPCGSGNEYAACCEPFIEGTSAPTAEATMRSRYTAFALGKIDYLRDTLPAKERKSFDRKSVTAWSTGSEWVKLEIHGTEQGQPGDANGTVEFTAHFVSNGNPIAHREKSIFHFEPEEGRWLLAKSITSVPAVRAAVPGRNEPCSCGSGKKYKKCHGAAG